MCTANDLNQRWVIDMGLPGPDAGHGGTHVICGPGYRGEVPDGAYSGTATTNRVLVLLRALPRGNDMAGAIEEIKTVKVYPLQPTAVWADPAWVNLSELAGADFTPVRWEDNLGYWKALHEVIDTEPPFDEFRAFYGELAELGIVKGQPFDPDPRMADILTKAAEAGHAQLCVQSFADRRPSRVVWAGPSGNGRCCGLRTAPSTPPATTTATPARNGSTKPRSSPRPCSGAPPAPGPCTGWALATLPAPISTAAAPTPSRCPCPSPPSCSGRSPSTTPARGARSLPNRTRRRCGPCSSSPTSTKPSPSSCTSGRRPRTEVPPAAGSRRSRERAGSPTSASTGRRARLRRHLAAPGLPACLTAPGAVKRAERANRTT